MSLLSTLKHISDHGNDLASKIIQYVGLPASGAGVVTGVAKDTYTTKLFTPSLWEAADFAAVAGGLASVFLIVQIIANLYFSIQERRLALKRKSQYENNKINHLADKLIEEIAKRQEEEQK